MTTLALVLSAHILTVLTAVTQIPVPANCPPPRNVPVLMPPEAVRMDFKGEVEVSVRFDDCGVVTEAKVTKRSRLQSVNDAALNSSKLMVLNNEQRAKAADGLYTHVISFATTQVP